MNGWRTVVVESPMILSERDGCLILLDAESRRERAVPLAQLREILVFHRKTTVTASLLAAAALQGISVIVCDRKYQPCSVALPLNQHNSTAGMIMDQMQWTQPRKDEIWMQIAKEKIKMQCLLLGEIGRTTPTEMLRLYENVRSGDPYNCEGQAAKIYFPILFGADFNRRSETNVNAALNYGYSILLSAMARIIVCHGYTTALGVHHCSRENALNLACDLMEPFRPLVDGIVLTGNGAELDMAFRKRLIDVMHKGCTYNRMETQVETAMEAYALDLFKAMRDDTYAMGEIGFER